MPEYTVTSRFIRKSVAALLQEWAEANGAQYSASCTGGQLRYFIDGEPVGRDELMQIQETRSVLR